MKFFLLFLPIILFTYACDLEKIEPGTGTGGSAKFSTTVGTNNTDKPLDVIATTDSGFVVAGYSTGNYQAYVAKVNNKGELQWEKSLGGPEDELATAVTEASDKGYVICGQSDSNLYIVKLSNATGGIVWEKSYGAADSLERGFGIFPGTGGEFWVAYTRAKTSNPEIRLMRINANGGIVQDKNVLYSTSALAMKRAIKTSTGQIAMVGYESNADGLNTYVLKLDSNGDFIWENRYPTSNTNFTPAYGITELADKSIVAAGSDLGSNDHDFNLVAYNNSGGIAWPASTWGGTEADELFDVDRTSDNELIVTGYSGSFSSQTEIYLSKRKAIDGSQIWEKHFLSISGDGIYVATCKDGGFIIAASQSMSNGDIILVKTDANGEYD